MNRRTLVGLSIALVVAALFAVRIAQAVRSRTAPATSELAPVPVDIMPVARRDIGLATAFTGVIRPLNEVEVFPKLAGRIEALTVEVGDRVRAGQTLAVIEHREIELQVAQAAAGRDMAAANADMAKSQWERFTALQKENAVAPADFDKVAVGHRLAQGQRKAAEAQLGLATEALRNAAIAAPIAGTVTRRNIDVGIQVNPMQPAFQVQDLRSLKVVGAVSARDFARLKVGQTATVTVDELPGEAFRGVVKVLSPTLDPMTRRAAIEITLDNTAGKLLPNMFAAVQIGFETRRDVLAVPANAIVTTAAGPMLFVVREGKAVSRTPTLGAADDAFVEIVTGLDEGEQIVVSGQSELTAGRAVSVGGAAN